VCERECVCVIYTKGFDLYSHISINTLYDEAYMHIYTSTSTVRVYRCLRASAGQAGVCVGLGVLRIADPDIPEEFHNDLTLALGQSK
jgi:hypothetical protein